MPILEMEEAKHAAVPSTSTAVTRPYNQMTITQTRPQRKLGNLGKNNDTGDCQGGHNPFNITLNISLYNCPAMIGVGGGPLSQLQVPPASRRLGPSKTGVFS